jgi:hypothetical protein
LCKLIQIVYFDIVKYFVLPIFNIHYNIFKFFKWIIFANVCYILPIFVIVRLMSNNDFVLPKLPVKDMHVSWYVSPRLNLFSNRNPNSSYPISGSGLHVLFLLTFHHFLSVWLASKVNLLPPSHKKWNLSFCKKISQKMQS